MALLYHIFAGHETIGYIWLGPAQFFKNLAKLFHLAQWLCYDGAVQSMRAYLSPAVRLYLKDSWIRLAFIPAIVLCLLAILPIIFIMPRQENIVLHYNIYFGIDLLGNWHEVLFIPLAGLILVILNTIIGSFIWRHDRVISYILGFSTVILSALVVVAVSLLVYINN